MKKVVLIIGSILMMAITIDSVMALSSKSTIDSLDADNKPELYHTLEEKKEAGLSTKIADRIKLSGLLEVEAGYIKTTLQDLGDQTNSYLVQATAQIGLEASINKSLSAKVIVLFEENETDYMALDEAVLKFEFTNLKGKLGRQDVPFGSFNSHFVTDPAPLRLGETKATAGLISFEIKPFLLAAYIFNGTADLDDFDELLLDWGSSIKFRPIEAVQVGVSIISDLADTDLKIAGEDISTATPGVNGFFIFEFEKFEVSGELVTALKSFNDDDLDVNADGQGDHPLAWNGELAYEINSVIEVALGVSGAQQLLGVPKIQYGLALSWGFWDHVSQTIEYLYSEYDRAYAMNDDGELMGKRHTVTTEVAVEF